MAEKTIEEKVNDMKTEYTQTKAVKDQLDMVFTDVPEDMEITVKSLSQGVDVTIAKEDNPELIGHIIRILGHKLGKTEKVMDELDISI